MKTALRTARKTPGVIPFIDNSSLPDQLEVEVSDWFDLLRDASSLDDWPSTRLYITTEGHTATSGAFAEGAAETLVADLSSSKFKRPDVYMCKGPHVVCFEVKHSHAPNNVIEAFGKQVLTRLLPPKELNAFFLREPSTDPAPVWSLLDAVYGEPKEDPLSGFDRYVDANWDGFDAEPINAQTIAAAREFLSVVPSTFGPPDVAPGANGTIGLEWLPEATEIVKLFIDIGPKRTWRAYWRRRDGVTRTIPAREFGARVDVEIEKLFAELNS